MQATSMRIAAKPKKLGAQKKLDQPRRNPGLAALRIRWGVQIARRSSIVQSERPVKLGVFAEEFPARRSLMRRVPWSAVIFLQRHCLQYLSAKTSRFDRVRGSRRT